MVSLLKTLQIKIKQKDKLIVVVAIDKEVDAQLLAVLVSLGHINLKQDGGIKKKTTSNV